MSYPYPQNRHLERKEKGDQPYQDAKEAVSQKDAQLQAEAEAHGEAKRDEERDLLEPSEETLRRLEQTGAEVSERSEAAGGS
ncbi:MAG TPA: hypothetical protein VGR16_08615 [Thermomicrobiales bacterium]|nr:hypothetical protein [Thermomicrobiales bacterium]